MEGPVNLDQKGEVPQVLSPEALTEAVLCDLHRRWVSILIQFKVISSTPNPELDSSKHAYTSVLDQVIEVQKMITPYLGGQIDRSNLILADFRMRLHDLINKLTAVYGPLSLLTETPANSERMSTFVLGALTQGLAIFAPDYDATFDKTFSRVRSFKVDGLCIEITELPPEFKSRVPKLKSFALSRIVENCFINAQKHGRAGQVTIRFEVMDRNRLKVFIADDGRGFQNVNPFEIRADQIVEGHGYAVAHARTSLEELGGAFYPLDLQAEGGATWVMELPFRE